MTEPQTTYLTTQPLDNLIGQLHDVPTEAAFLAVMLQLQCRIVSARCGAIWRVGPPPEAPSPPEDQETPSSEAGAAPDRKLHLAAVWPGELAEAGPDSPTTQLLARAAATGLQRSTDLVLKVQQQPPPPAVSPEGESTAPQVPSSLATVYVTLLRGRGGEVEAGESGQAEHGGRCGAAPPAEDAARGH